MTFYYPNNAHRMSFFLAALVFFAPATTAFAQMNQETCLANADAASSQIANGFFDEAIDLLVVCEDADFLSNAEKAQIIKLLADAYLAKRYVSEARDAIAKLLDVAPNFTPDVNLDSQLFRDLVAELRAERQPPPTPADFTVRAEDGEVELSWTRIDSDDVDRIRILRAEAASTLAAIDSVSATATGYTDLTAAVGTSYYYSVQAVATNGVEGERTDVQRVTITAGEVEETPVASTDPSPPKSGSKKWIFIGGGVAAAGAVAAVLLGGGGGDGPNPPTEPPDPLPGPPGIP